jgi:hypothetical protein
LGLFPGSKGALSRFLPVVGLICLLSAGLLPQSVGAQSPIVSSRQLPFITALQVADQAFAAVAANKNLPDNFQLSFDDRPGEVITAAQALVLLAAAGESLRQGRLDPLPLFPAETGAPIAFNEAPLEDQGLLLPAQAVLGQAKSLLDFTVALGSLPNAVWVGKQRIPSADYLVALAAILQFASKKQVLPAQVKITACYPPASWRLKRKADAPPPLPLPPAKLPQSLSWNSAPPPLLPPKLEIIPGNGAKLSGKVNLVAVLTPAGTDANVTVSLDKRPLLHSNWPPFSLLLDTAGLAPGKHKIGAIAEETGGRLLASKEIVVIVDNAVPASPEKPEKAQDTPPLD